MTQTIRAIFENGVLRPLDPLALEERAEVSVIVNDQRAGAANQESTKFHTFEQSANAPPLTAEMVRKANNEEKCVEPTDEVGTHFPTFDLGAEARPLTSDMVSEALEDFP